MTIQDILLLALIGLAAGAFSGLAGLGGSLVIIPGLIYAFGMEQHIVQGTSIAVMLPPVGILAARKYFKHGHVNIPFTVWIIIGFLFGCYFGSKLALDIPSELLRKGFAITIFILSLQIFFTKKREYKEKDI